MAYLFAPVATDKITMGTGVSLWTQKCSLFARFQVTNADATAREIVTFVTAGIFDWQFFLEFTTGATNQIQWGYRDTTPSYHFATWTTGFTAGSIHTLVGTIDLTLGSANVKLYADTDATEKASVTTTVRPIAATAPVFLVGNHPDSPTQSLGGTLYELAFWPPLALTGGQCSALGGASVGGIPQPPYCWGLVADAFDTFGGQHGTVTGATVVAHAGTNLDFA